MKRVIIGVLLLTCFYSARAQIPISVDTSLAQEKKENYRWAVQLGGKPTFSTLNQDPITNLYLFARRNVSARHGWQIGLWGYANPDEQQFSNDHQGQNGTPSVSVELGTGVHVAVQYLWYLPLTRRFRGIFGMGPAVGAGFWERKMKWTEDTGDRVAKTRISRLDAGVLGTFTVEWRFTNQFSFNATLLTRWGIGIQSDRYKAWEVVQPAGKNILDTQNAKKLYIFAPEQAIVLGVSVYLDVVDLDK